MSKIFKMLLKGVDRFRPLLKRAGRFQPLKSIYYSLFSLLKPKVVIIEGHKIFLGPKDTYGMVGIHEPAVTEIIKRYVKRGDVVLDIGANIGYHTLTACKVVGENGKVYAFEPEQNNFALLRKNVEANGYKNVVLVNKAVSNKSGRSKLFLSEFSGGTHSLYKYNYLNKRKFVWVDVISLNDFFKNKTARIRLIKMDVEGAEGLVLHGMTTLLKKNKSLILIIEFWPKGLERFTGAEKFLKTLESHGFRFYYIKRGKTQMEPVTKAHLLEEFAAAEKGTLLFCFRNVAVPPAIARRRSNFRQYKSYR
jgi:FkbM family methyltransferase